jgi:hypothetical protein
LKLSFFIISVHLNDLQLKTRDINNSSEDLILPSSQELRIAAEGNVVIFITFALNLSGCKMLM